MTGPTLAITLPEWEGPLDLLLHVIRTHKLDILDIPIAFVTEQYLAYLDTFRQLNLDIAGEYLEMAATLAHIKSRMMLPAPPKIEDELAEEPVDPREELIRRLLEYQRYKEAARELGERPRMGRDTFGPASPPLEESGGEPEALVELGLFDLAEAFRRILARTKSAARHDVTVERMTISERISEIADALRPGALTPFDQLFQKEANRFDVVITLLALLEMARLRMIRLFQASNEGDLYVTLGGSRPVDGGGVSSRHALTTEARRTNRWPTTRRSTRGDPRRQTFETSRRPDGSNRRKPMKLRPSRRRPVRTRPAATPQRASRSRRPRR